MNDISAVISVFAGSFLSATLLPGYSEILLVTLLTIGSVSPLMLVLTATLGNTLGGVINVAIGRWLPRLNYEKGASTALRWLQKFGPVTLLLSWLPIVGDLLCLLAGWLRMPVTPVVVFLCLGKALRYIIITAVTLKGITLWH